MLGYVKSTGCEYPDVRGDGICNHENNVERCGWDGGDCCGAFARYDTCDHSSGLCKCLDPDAQTCKTVKGDACKDTSTYYGKPYQGCIGTDSPWCQHLGSKGTWDYCDVKTDCQFSCKK